MTGEYPILEFDSERESLIEPSKVLKPLEIPPHCVLAMYDSVLRKLKESSCLSLVTEIRSMQGNYPVFRMEHHGKSLTVANPGLGAPLVAAFLEELIAFGCRKFMACGSAGVLDSSLAPGTVVIPTSAVRDEGTSYHYIAPAREIQTDPDVVAVAESVLRTHRVPYRLGKTWTTDAIYRETKKRIARRRAEGCLAAEMECAAFLAVAKFRGVRLGQLLAAGDDLGGKEWDCRDALAPSSFHERLFWLAVEVCLHL